MSYDSADAVRKADLTEFAHGGCLVPGGLTLAPLASILVHVQLPGELEVEVPARVVNVVPGIGAFVQFEGSDEVNALRSAAQFVLSMVLTPAPSDPPLAPVPEAPVPELPLDDAAWLSSDAPLPDVAPVESIDADGFLSVEPLESTGDSAGESTATAERTVPKAVWELIDATSTVPLHVQLRELSTQDKIRLARHATRPVRTLLIRDSEKRIHAEVIQNPRVTDEELIEYTADAGLSPTALRWVANQRRLVRVHGIMMNLVLNPQTPPDIALSLLATLPQPDLLRVARSTRVREPIMRAAKRKLMESGVL